MAPEIEILNECLTLFTKKTKDYGTAWRILRPSSLTDQILIKAKRAHSITRKGAQKVADDIREDYIGMINYGILSLIQLELPEDAPVSLDPAVVILRYTENIEDIKLRFQKGIEGVDLISAPLLPVTETIIGTIMLLKHLEDSDNTATNKVGKVGCYQDIILYSLLCLVYKSKS